MAVSMLVELTGATPDDYDRLKRAMGIHGPEDEPEGLISHDCAPDDFGLMIFDVWRSQEEAEDFLKNRVLPAATQLGLLASRPRFGSVHYHLR